MAEQKSYTGTLQLGVETDTLDCTGTVTRTASVPACTPTQLRKIEQRFMGDSWQTPPMYSALKRKGVPLYKLARQGIEVEREPRRVHISHLALTLGEPHTIHFSVSCSKGTYIRVLAAEVGMALNTLAHLTSLRRTTFGAFTIDQASPLSQVRSLQPGQPLPLLSSAQATRSYRTFVVSAPEAALIRHGQQAFLRTLPAAARATGETARILSAERELIAMPQAVVWLPAWDRRLRAGSRRPGSWPGCSNFTLPQGKQRVKMGSRPNVTKPNHAPLELTTEMS